MSLATTLALALSAFATNADSDGTTERAVNFAFNESLPSGTGSGKADLVYHATRTLGGSSETLDLSGSLTDYRGATLSFAGVKVLAIKNKGANDLTVGNAASNQWQGPMGTISMTHVIKPGGCHVFLNTDNASGWAVVNGASDLLKVAGTAADAYEILIIGVSA